MQVLSPLTKVKRRQDENRKAMAGLLKKGADMTDEDRNELTALTETAEQLIVEHRAAELSEDEFQANAAKELELSNGDGESAEYRKLRDQVSLIDYTTAAVEHRAAEGAAAEFNQHLDIPGNHFPLSMLFKSEIEHRTKTDIDTVKTTRPWADMLFSMTKAEALGIRPDPVPAGQASYPLTKTGPTAGAQKGREEAATATAWTTATIDKDPSRNTVAVDLNNEDVLRNPQLRPAIERHCRKAIVVGIDKAIFLSDAGANEDSADITGLADITSLTEKTITQANVAKPDKNLELFTSLLDGVHAESLSDLGVVLSVPANTLWYDTTLSVASETASIFKTLRAHMMEQGLSWQIRADLADATTNGHWLAFISRKIGLEDSYACPLWDSGKMVVDEYTGARSGKLLLTLHYFWHFQLVRLGNFARAKYVT